jgi:dTMP kinase
MFLAFEGADGAGKSTQVKLLAEHFERQGREVVICREPGGTELGEKLRGILLDPGSGDMGPEAEVLLFMAARAQLCSRVIRPAIEAGKVVISDRFLWSSVVYQGIVGGLGIEEVLSIGRVATGGLLPELTFLIDLDPADAHSSLDEGDRMESRGLDFQREVREGFAGLAADFSDNFALIDGSGSVEQVHEQVIKALPQKQS